VPVLASLRADVKLASIEQNIAWGLKGVPCRECVSFILGIVLKTPDVTHLNALYLKI